MSGMVPDGQQGAIAWWEFEHYIPEYGDASYVERAQRIDVLGNFPAPWPAGGIAVRNWSNAVNSYIFPIALLTDGAGGAFYAENRFSYDGGEPRTRFNLYRIGANGSVTGVQGYSGFLSGPVVDNPVVVDADGTGGVIFMTGNPLLAQRVTAAGNNLWPWPQLSHATVVGKYDVLTDGTGGAFFAWCEQPSGGQPALYVQHLDGNGAVHPGWPSAGRLVSPLAGVNVLPGGSPPNVSLASNGAGGVFVAWVDQRNGQLDLIAHCVLADGSLATGIPAGGRSLGTPQSIEDLRLIESDEQGGIFVVRASRESVNNYYEERLLRLDAALLLREGWPSDGLSPVDNGLANLQLVADGQGGAFLAYLSSVFSNGIPRSAGLFGQHLAGNGLPAPGWTSEGYLLSATGGGAFIVRSGDGAIVAWTESEYDRPGEGGIYAQRLVPDGPVAVQVSLVSADVAPGEASLHWYVSDAAALSASVERRTDTSEWAALGTVSADGQGHVRYLDRTVGSGRFAYRLSWFEDGDSRQSAEVWVDVPETWKLALSVRHANPGAGPAVFAVTLPSRSTGSIELLDLQGRRVAHRDLGPLEAGAHTVTIDEASTLAPGVYLARLTHGAETRTTRVVRVR